MVHFLPQPRWDEKNKRWILRIQINNRRKAFTSSLPRTEGKKEVRAKAERWLETFDANTSVTFGTAFERFLNDYHDHHGETETYKQHLIIGKNHLLPKLKNIRCGDLRIEDYQDCISNAKPIKRQGKTKTYSKTDRLAKKTLKNIRATIIAFNKWATARKYSDLMLSDTLYLPQNAPSETREILQLSDIEKIFAEPTGQHYERAIWFQILTGVRPGELMGLKISDYDTATGIMHIRRAITSSNQISQGKNKNARRDIYLPDRVRQIVLDQIQVSKSLHSDWLFCQPSGQHGTQKALSRALDRICEFHGITVHVTPYSLRHTFFTHTEAFVPDRMIKMVFGHGDKTDSHALYGNHAIDGELKEFADKLEVTPIYKAVKH